MTGQVARKIADGVGLAGAGRPIKQDALAGRLSEPPQVLPGTDKVQHVAVKQFQGGFGQDHLLASHGPQFVDRDAA